MHWVYLLLAIGLEVAGTTCMKLAEGFSKLLPSILVFVFYGGTLVMLTLAFEKLPVSVAYTVWGSVGTVLIVVIGKTWFDESLSTIQYARSSRDRRRHRDQRRPDRHRVGCAEDGRAGGGGDAGPLTLAAGASGEGRGHA